MYLEHLKKIFAKKSLPKSLTLGRPVLIGIINLPAQFSKTKLHVQYLVKDNPVE